MRVLGIETSCDETSVACVGPDGVASNLISSQVDLHAKFGGVVPELASRAHLTNLLPVISVALDEAGWTLDDVEAVAATSGPGLIGAVLIGLTGAKTLAWSRGIPFVGVHHIEGHILANGIDTPMEFPALALVVSGGHTETVAVRAPGAYRRIGATLDDAAGETFDKTAKLLGLPYPGGPQIQRVAVHGDPTAVPLPRGLARRDSLDFSFSGLKTAVRLAIEALGPDPAPQAIADIAASLQEAIVDTLIDKTRRALRVVDGVRGIYLAGGVAANGPLRERFAALAAEERVAFTPPRLGYCTDNAAMIAWAGRLRLLQRGGDAFDLPAFARGGLPSWADA